jgi:hypothetical protein
MKEDQTILSRTDKTAVDKIFRLQCKIESRIQYFTDAVANWKHATASDYDTLRAFTDKHKNYIQLLDKYKLITHDISAEDQLEYIRIYGDCNWDNRKEHLKQVFGIPQKDYNSLVLDKNVSHYVNQMADGQKKNCIQRIKSRLTIELTEAYLKNKFVIFSSLTVNPESYEEVFTKGSNCWRNYIRCIERYCLQYGENFSYLAVVEQGAKTGRLHIHSIMVTDSIGDWKDPNMGRYIADDIEGIKEPRYYWKYGHSTHYAVRFSQHDAFGKLGWIYPVEYNSIINEYLPRNHSEIGKIVGYMTKYITKSQSITKEGEVTLWKTKMNRTYGLQSLNKIIQKLPLEQLVALVVYRKFPRPIRVYGQPIPSKLVRHLARKELQINRKRYLNVLKKQDNFKTLLKTTINPKQKSNIQNFGTILTQIMSNMDICNDYYWDYIKAWRKIGTSLPPLSEQTSVHGGITKKIKNV